MTEINTGNAVHYADLAITALRRIGYGQDADDLEAHSNVFKHARMLHPQRVMEQSRHNLETWIEEVGGYVEIPAETLVAIFIMNASFYTVDNEAEVLKNFDKSRCWKLADEADRSLKSSDPDLSKLQVAAQAKFRHFLRFTSLTFCLNPGGCDLFGCYVSSLVHNHIIWSSTCQQVVIHVCSVMYLSRHPSYLSLWRMWWSQELLVQSSEVWKGRVYS